MENWKARSLAVFLLLAGLGASAGAHPMGSASVNHYARITPDASGVEILYVLDLGETPASEVLGRWGFGQNAWPARRAEIERNASAQARDWVRNLAITENGRTVEPRLESSEVTMPAGDGGLTMRVVMRLRLAVNAGKLEYEDRNYPGRSGWKEIAIAAGTGTVIQSEAPAYSDRTQALTVYPENAIAAAPQDLRASLEWTAGTPAPGATGTRAASRQTPTERESEGSGIRADFLSQLLHRRELGMGLLLAGLGVAFILGAIHALSPGHGKTLVAAYLVGTHGTVKHALLLGGVVTFTHTISVFFLGFVTLFLSQYVLPEKISTVLGAISGITIVWIGATMLYKRVARLRGGGSRHGHDHGHTHGPGGHSHVPEGDVTLGGLIALGASGGLVPCPSALVLLLSAIALERVGLGMILLVSFSAGLAVVLMAIGVVVIYAKHWLPDTEQAVRHPAFRLIPVFSAGLIVCIGLVMTGVSLGVIRPDRIPGMT